ncbi:MAG TPA: hypothetical protein VF472_07650 [Burkholderiaceae bacterium]
MKTSILASVLSAAAIGAVAQPAPQQSAVQQTPEMQQQAPGDNSSTVTITGKGPTIDLPVHPRSMTAGEYSRYTGSYELTNGDSVALFTRGLKKYAKLHGGVWHEMVAASDASFVAKDRKLKVSFVTDEDGRLVSGDVLMVVPDDRYAKLHRKQPPRLKVQDVAMR